MCVCVNETAAGAGAALLMVQWLDDSHELTVNARELFILFILILLWYKQK